MQAKYYNKLKKNLGNRARNPPMGTEKIFGLVTIIFLVFVMLFAWLGFEGVKNKNREQNVRVLESILNSTHETLKEYWLDNLFYQISIWASDPVLIRYTEEFLENSEDVKSILESSFLKDTRSYFKNRLSRDFQGFFVISPNYINVASMRDENIGQTNIIAFERPSRIGNVFLGKNQLVPPIPSDVSLPNKQGVLVNNYPTMFLLVPIKNHNKQVIAALSIQLDPFGDFSGIAQKGKFGKTGKTYIFDKKLRLVTESRFIDQLIDSKVLISEDYSLLNLEVRDPGVNLLSGKRSKIPVNQQPPTFMAKNALLKARGNSSIAYRDYRGVPVVGAWLWDEEIQLGFTTEIDESEVLESYHESLQIFGFVILIMILLGLVALFIMNRAQRRAAQKIAISESYLESILINAVSGFIIFDENGIIQKFNHAAEKLFGYSQEEIKGKNIYSLFPDLMSKDSKMIFNNFIISWDEDLFGKGHELIGQRKNLEEFPVLMGISKNEIGKNIFYSAVFQDLTDIKSVQDELNTFAHALKEQQRHLNNVLNTAPAIIFIKDKNGRYLFVNHAFQSTYGFEQDQILGHTDWDLFPKEKADEFFEKDKNALNRLRAIHTEETIGNSDNNRVLLTTKFALRDTKNKIYALAGWSTDITELKQVQKELSKERILAESANRAKSEFLANMSHEIRTPMNAIIGMVRLVLQTSLDLKQRNYLQKINDSAYSLLTIINDILDFSKIEAGRLELENINFSLDLVLNNISSLMALKSYEKGLEFLFDISPDVPFNLKGDSVRLIQILTNFVGNAIKFTHEGEIIIFARVAEWKKNDVKIQFSVKDSGIGITEKQIKLLFRPFSQTDNSMTRKYGGTGLGLAICKRLCNLMGGEIDVTSEFSNGSTFSFTSWFETNIEENYRKKYEPHLELKELKVLVIDDNLSSQNILKTMIENFGCHVTLAEDGMKGIQNIASAEKMGLPFKIVLIDYNMPNLNGIETIRKIRNFNQYQSGIKLILLTSFANDNLKHDVEQVSVDGYLFKPVTYPDLFETLMKAIEAHPQFLDEEKSKKYKYPVIDSNLKGSRILLVEDNEISQDVALELLENIGVFVDLAGNGKEALEMLKKQQYDGVLMDMQMPVMDGLKATIEIRKIKFLQSLPIIATTANALTGDREKCLKAGMNDYIPKPIFPSAMFATLKKWIKPSSNAKPISTGQSMNKTELDLKLDGINVGQGLISVGGNKKLYFDLLRKFCEREKDFFERFNYAQKRNDKEETVRIVHNVKGSAVQIGAYEVHKAATSLEASCIDGNDQKIMDFHLSELKRVLLPILSTLGILDGNEEKQTQPKETTNPSTEIKNMKIGFDELLALLKQNDANGLDVMREINKRLTESPIKLELMRIEKLLEKFEFDEAVPLLESLESQF